MGVLVVSIDNEVSDKVVLVVSSVPNVDMVLAVCVLFFNVVFVVGE